MGDKPPPFCKLPRRYENPLDWIIIGALQPVVPLMVKVGMTANGVTILSILCKVLALWYFNAGKTGKAIAWWGVQYVLDCLDGMVARAVGETKFGDVLDHGSDLLSIVAVYGIIARNLLTSRRPLPWWPLVVEAALVVVSMTHFTCQEKYSRENSRYLPVAGVDITGCMDVDVMKRTRYFGVGTHTVWMMYLMYFYRR